MENTNNYGKVIGPDTVRFERLLPGPIERAWAYLTEPEKRAKWLAGGEMDLRIGGAMKLWFHHKTLDAVPDEAPEKYKKYENGNEMAGRVTRCEPPNVLGISWGKGARESEVIFELAERGKDVLLVLTHHRLPDRNEMLGVSGGWHTHLNVLVEHLRGHTSPPFWAAIAKVNEEYEKRIA